MKKTILVGLIFVLLISCGKKESGTFVVQNNSSYTVHFGIGQDYRTEEYTVKAGQTKSIDWNQYLLFYPIYPKNIISYRQNNSKAVIVDMLPMCNYTIDNAICDSLDILDGKLTNGLINDNDKKYILSNGSISVDKIKIEKGKKDIKCFRKINTSDIILSGKELTISQSDSVSGKEEKCRECETIGETSFLCTIKTDISGKKYFMKQEILLKIIETPLNNYLYITLY